MAIILNGTDQGVNCGLSAPILSSAGSIFTYMEIVPSRSVDETPNIAHRTRACS